MGIFSSIRDAIFGHPKAQAAPAPQATPQTPAMPQLQPTAAATPTQPVDVEAVLVAIEKEKGGAALNWRTSIVDLMKLLGLESSLENRKELATELGWLGEKDGSAEMNIWLHKEVMRALAKNGGTVPASMQD